MWFSYTWEILFPLAQSILSSWFTFLTFLRVNLYFHWSDMIIVGVGQSFILVLCYLTWGLISTAELCMQVQQPNDFISNYYTIGLLLMPTVISPQLPLLELLPSLGTCQFYLLKLARLKRNSTQWWYLHTDPLHLPPQLLELYQVLFLFHNNLTSFSARLLVTCTSLSTKLFPI